MRRLLLFVAALGALLVAPAVALALDAPVPGAPPPTNVLPVVINWTDSAGGLIYHVFRADQDCATALPGDFSTPIGGDVPPGIGTYTDNTVVTQGRYCYFVQADDGLATADSIHLAFLFDTTAPSAPAVTQTGGNGCSAFTLTGASSTDNLGPVTYTVDPGLAFPQTPAGTPFAAVTPTPRVTATDAAGNTSSTDVPGLFFDDTRPPAPVLEVATDPAQQKVTLNWASVTADGAPVVKYHVRTKGPTGPPDVPVDASVNSLVFAGLQVDATYEYSLVASDACGDSLPSVRVVRLNDTAPPSQPILADPAFISSSKAVKLSWVPSTDNIQVDHYQILRNGIPLAATDATDYTDTNPGQHVQRSYVVRAVDTNGNTADSDPATITTPDWTPPTAPVPEVTPLGTTVTVRWPAAVDNVGVVGYDVLRDGKVKGTMTAAVRVFQDISVPVGPHNWVVRARDAANLSRDSIPKWFVIKKLRAGATLVGLKMAGATRGGAARARYSLAGPARLLLDVRIVGTLRKAVLRIYVQSGKGRITVWRGTPASSSPRERLHSALSRHGYVSIHLGRTLHAGRTRLVLIASGRMVIVGSGRHKPSLRAG